MTGMSDAVSRVKAFVGRVVKAVKEAVKELTNPDVWRRASKTFWQAAVASITLPAVGAFNLTLVKALAIAAAAAGASAAWNGVIKPLIEQIVAHSKVPVPGTQPGPTPQGS